MIKIKDDSITLGQLHPALALVLAATVVPALARHGIDCTITSGDEQGVAHGVTSLHYVGCAVDIRTRDPATGQPFAGMAQAFTEIKQALNCDFDLIDEGDHWHLEFQPKRR